MKKILIFITTILFILTTFALSIDIEPGIMLGYRTVNSDDINDTYGSSLIFSPNLEVKLLKWLAVGAGYELGYSKDGEIGVFNETATLSLSGFDFFTSFSYKIKKVTPFLKLGVSIYSYDQTVTTAFGDINASDTKLGWLIAAGAKIYAQQRWALSIEIRYSLLEVEPEGLDPVDLGGLKIYAGIGYTFNL